MTEMTDEEVFGKPKEMSDAEVFGRPAAPTYENVSESIPEAFLDRLRAGQAIDRIVRAAGHEAGHGLVGQTPTGFSDESLNHLIDLGIFHDPAKGRGGPIQMVNEAVMMSAAQLWQGVTGTLAAGIHGAGGAFGQLVEEFGGSQGTANRAKNEVINAGNWALIESGMGRFSRPQVEPQVGVTEKVVGGLPQEADFVNAAKILAPEPIVKVPSVVDGAPDIVSAPTQKARSLGSYMDIAENWVKDPEGTYSKLDSLREEVVATERELKKKYGVKKVEDLDDADLTPAERHFLFYETSPTDRDVINNITRQLQPVDSLGEAAKEIAYEFKRLPADLSKMNDTEQLAAMRLQVLFSEVGRLGGDLNQVLKEAGSKYAARFSDPEDALFMAQNAADSLRKMFTQGEQKTPLQITDQNLRRMWKEDGITPAEAVHDAQSDAFLKHEITAKQVELKIDPAAAEELELSGGKPGDLGAAATLPPNVPLSVQPASPPGRLTAAAQSAAETLFDIGRDIQMKTTPMARGTQESQRIVKDYLNIRNRNDWDASRIDTDTLKRFSPEQRARMANAMEEESLSLRLGEPESARQHQGLNTLTPEERAFVTDLDTRQQIAWQRARDLGIVEGEGIAMHFPRMVINAKGADREGAMSLTAMGYDLKTRTPGMKQRKYMELEETERAAKAKYGEQAVVARDIRTVNLATKQLEDAIAGRTLIDNIKEVGKRTGEDVVAEGFKPDKTWVTVDHPAFKAWRPKLDRLEDGSFGAIKDAEGNTIFEQVPLYVRGDFEGPLRAAMWGDSGAVYTNMMALKGKTMGLIMNSPLIHGAVEWGRALAAAPVEVGSLRVYFTGNKAKHDVGLMHEAINHGLVPIGKRFFNQDINSIMETPDLTPGRSMTAKVAGFIGENLPQKGMTPAEVATQAKTHIDKAGDFWHNTLLWDRIADLQAGLYVHFRDGFIAKGMDRSTASYIAAHEANRFAGALPKDTMGEMATKVANFGLFSRSFTVGNLGVIKDAFGDVPAAILNPLLKAGGLPELKGAGGLPAAVLAQIEKESGAVVATSAKAAARRKAITTLMLEMGLMYAGNSVLQSAINTVLLDRSISEEAHDYWTRMKNMVTEKAAHPLSLLQPFKTAEDLSATSENEPGRKERLYIGNAKDGTAIYARSPAGKIGEEFVGYFSSPLDMLKKKEGTILRPALQILSNDAGFGRKIYDSQAEDWSKYIDNAAAVMKHFMLSQLPAGQLNAAADLVKGEGDKFVNAAQAFGPFAGVTFSKGAPGGKAVGEMYASRAQHEFQVNKALPDIRKQILRGDIEGAVNQMTELDVPQGLQRFYIKTTLNPATRLSPRAVRDFYLHASPEQRARFERAQQAPQPQE